MRVRVRVMMLMAVLLADIQRNGDLYRNTDIRPAYTYASLIRQVSSPVSGQTWKSDLSVCSNKSMYENNYLVIYLYNKNVFRQPM